MSTERDDEKTLATELLHELKMAAKRWFIAFCIMVALELATIGGFLWYISLPVENYDSSEQTVDNVDLDNSNLTQTIGGDK